MFAAKFGKTFLSCEILHEIFGKYSNFDCEKIIKYLNFVEEQKDLEFLKNYVSGKNAKKQTILFHFDYKPSSLINILNWLQIKFQKDRNFLKNILLQFDENQDSFFTFVLRECWSSNVENYFTETYKFLIRNFDKTFVKNFLLIQNEKNENFLNVVFEKRYVEQVNVSNILDLLFKDFQNDQDFFTVLFNAKSKKNQIVKNWMKNKLGVEFEDENENSKVLGACEEKDGESSSSDDNVSENLELSLSKHNYPVVRQIENFEISEVEEIESSQNLTCCKIC
jgi:hypothetical protein